jgi:hypothetical protein
MGIPCPNPPLRCTLNIKKKAQGHPVFKAKAQLMSYALFRSRWEAYTILVRVGVGLCHTQYPDLRRKHYDITSSKSE